MVAIVCHASLAQARVYRVKKGDWLGKISRRFLPGDPYGKNGSVKRIVRLNPDIHNPDEIVPNELVYIPDMPPAKDGPALRAKHKAVAHKAQPKKRPAQAATTHAKPCRCAACPSLEHTQTLKCAEPPPCHAGTLPDQTGSRFDKAGTLADASTTPITCPAPVACNCAAQNCKSVAILQNQPDPTVTQGPLGGSLHRHLRLRLAPYFRFSELQAQDDNTGVPLTLASRYNTGITGGISVNAVEYLEVALDLRGGMLDYVSPTRNATLLTSALFSYAVTANAELTILKRLGLYLGITFGNEPFAMSDSTQILEVAMVNLPAVTAGLSITALKFAHWQLGAEAQGAYKLGTTEKGYTVHPGAMLAAGVFWQWNNPDDTAWTVSAGYSQRQQNTTLITQTDKTLNVEACYRWSL